MVFQCRHEQHEDIDVFLLYIAKLSHIDCSLDLIFSQPLLGSVYMDVCCVPAEVSVFICRVNGRIIRSTRNANGTQHPDNKQRGASNSKIETKYTLALLVYFGRIY